MAMRDLIPWSRQTNVPADWRQDAYDPVASLQRNMRRLIDDVFREPFPAAGFGRSFSAAWPSVEVNESDTEVRISAEIPGMNEKDVELFVDDGVLTLRGERKSETEDRDRGYSERYYGRFERRIALPANADEDAAKADFRDGMLTVTIPKTAESARGRRIPINDATRH